MLCAPRALVYEASDKMKSGRLVCRIHAMCCSHTVGIKEYRSAISTTESD